MHRSAVRDWEEPELLWDLPHNIELEQAFLGALLTSNASYHRVSPLVTPADFYEPLHGRLFEAIANLVAKDSPATPLTLTPFFEGETVGPRSFPQYLGHLIATATNVVNAEHHAAAIADLRRRRTLARVGLELAHSALTDFTASLEAQIVGALGELYAISHGSPSVCGFTAGEAARIAIEQIAAAYEKGCLSEPGAASVLKKPSA